jgi:hypothetical protein
MTNNCCSSWPEVEIKSVHLLCRTAINSDFSKKIIGSVPYLSVSIPNFGKIKKYENL